METCKLIYDGECPLCKAYTSAFQKHGLLNEGERISFQEAEATGLLMNMDMPRSRHTIPFVNTVTGEITYGVDALGLILGRRWPWIHRMVQFPPVHGALTVLYRFISYNRRVIPIIPRKAGAAYYGPDLHPFYRLMYMLLVTMVSVVISFRLGQHLQLHPPFEHLNGGSMVAAVGIGWALHLALSITLLRGRDRWDYAGHIFTVMLIGVLLLTPYLLLGALVILPAWAGWIAVDISMGMMCIQHLKRLRALGLPRYYFFTWLATLLTVFLMFIFIHP